MRKQFAAALAAAVVFTSFAAPAGAQSVSISPSSGNQDQPFVVAGEGLPAGLALDINFQSPNGDVFSTAAMNKVVVVDPSGAFTFEMTPSNEFHGQPTGSWLVQVCIAGMDQCVQTDFSISE